MSSGPLGWSYPGESYAGDTTPPPAVDPTLFQDCIDLGEPRATRMLAALPPYFASDPTIRAYLCTCARELNRIEAAADALRLGSFPATANESTLEFYERMFGLSSVGLSTAQRQSDVIAHIRKRRVATRFDWQTALTAFIGSAGWSYVETPPYTVLIHAPVDPTGDRTAAIAKFARAITPAHLTVTVTGDYGAFQIGISHIGDHL
jgi:hypothetical protein